MAEWERAEYRELGGRLGSAIRVCAMLLAAVVGWPAPSTAQIADSFDWPIPGYRAGSYGNRTFWTYNHLGEDHAADPGTPVRAIANGRIVEGGMSAAHCNYGMVVVIEHELAAGVHAPDGATHVVSVYGHLSNRDGLQPRLSGQVRRGDIIGYVGHSGGAPLLARCGNDDENGDGGPHLHLGLRLGRHPGRWVYYGYVGGGETRYPEGRFVSATDFIENAGGAAPPDWWCDAIGSLNRLGIMERQCADFVVGDALNRAEWGTLISRSLRLENSPAFARCQNPFSDVGDDAWYASHLAALAGLDYGDGTAVLSIPPDRRNRPGDIVNRCEAVKTIIEAWDPPPRGAPDLVFSDRAQIPDWCRPYVEQAVAYGIVTNRAAAFGPSDELSTGAGATMLVNAVNLLGRPLPAERDFNDLCDAGGPACQNLCNNGSRRCSGGARQSCRDENGDGCTEWVADPCGGGQRCEDGVCVDGGGGAEWCEPCGNGVVCAAAAPRCVGWNDHEVWWCMTACDNDADCQPGWSCAAVGACFLSAYQCINGERWRTVCGDPAFAEPCAAGSHCDGDRCVPDGPVCQNACNAGARRCDGGVRQRCGDENGDGCTEWVADACAANLRCDNGACVMDGGGVDRCADVANAGVGATMGEQFGDDLLQGSCGGRGAEVVYRFQAPAAARWRFHTGGSEGDTLIYLRVACDNAAGEAELGCNDDAVGLTSAVEVELAAQQVVFVVVDAFSANGQGPFQLTIERVIDEPVCQDACEAAQRRCEAGTRQRCVVGADGCADWQADPCDAGQECDAGVCVAAPPVCQDSCVAGTSRCAQPGRQVCRDANRDGCVEWVNDACGANERCSNGLCEPVCEPACANGSRRCARVGRQVCRDTGGNGCTQWVLDACTGTDVCENGDCVPLPAETCNGLDDDEDGRIDEDVQNACGQCGEVPPEVCNGRDDDCDGQIDEGLRNACGECGDVPREVCNGRDDDCDGQIDEGVCSQQDASTPSPLPNAEVCDGLDQNGNGQIDEGAPCPPGAACKDGVCQRTDVESGGSGGATGCTASGSSPIGTLSMMLLLLVGLLRRRE